MRDHLIFNLNGTKKKVSGESAFFPLSQFLRSEQGLTGTKIVCSEGDCGACTVLVQRPWLAGQEGEEFRPVNSCIFPLGLADGTQIVTIEGLQKLFGELTEVQQKMAEHQGGQCGFCTPGFVMAMTGMYENRTSSISEKTVKNHLTGNLCRCTGYAPILEAAMHVDTSKLKRVRDVLGDRANRLVAETEDSFCVRGQRRKFYGPRSLNEALKLKSEISRLRAFGAATDLGVQLNKERLDLRNALSLHRVEELQGVYREKDYLRIGAAASLAQVERSVGEDYPEFSDFLHIFASSQIKNVATLGGNIVNASPIADTLPFLLALEAELELASLRGERTIPVERFFQGYKQIDLAPDEILKSIKIPARKSEWVLKVYKVSQRRDLDISGVNACFYGDVKGKSVRSLRVVYGGVGPTVLRLKEVEAFLLEKTLDSKTIAEAQTLIRKQISPVTDARGTQEYRYRLSENLFKKFCHQVSGAR